MKNHPPITDCGCPYDDNRRQGHSDYCPTLVALTWPDGQPKTAPVQGYAAGIPWSVHLDAYNAYVKRYSRQSALIDLDRRGCRGGFGTEELDGFVPGWRDKVGEIYALRARIAELDALVYAPGAWRCAKCDFQLNQMNLNAADGSVTARDTPGDKCPNCDGPLWRVSWRQEAHNAFAMVETQFEEIQILKRERPQTPALIYWLGLMCEEMGEALQWIGKALRFGYDTPGRKGADGKVTGETPRDLLPAELGDVQAAIQFGTTHGFADMGEISGFRLGKIRRLLDPDARDNLGRPLAPQPTPSPAAPATAASGANQSPDGE